MSHINLRQLAKAAGVSVAAASFAFNNKPGVSDQVRRHILEVAAKLGYERDAKMVELMAHIANRRQRSDHDTLALITRHGRARVWEVNPSVKAFWVGAGKRAKELGYHLEEFRYDEPGLSPTRLRSILRSRNIQGLLFSMHPQVGSDLRLDFDFTGFAGAMSGICFTEPEIDCVLPDHFNNVVLCMQRAYDLGYRRPLLAFPAGATKRTLHRMEGAYYYFAQQHPDLDRLPIYAADDYQLSALLGQIDQHRPDVVICTHGEWGKEIGRRVPAEFGWISLNWTPGEDRLAGLDRLLEAQAGFVVDLVVAQIHRGESGVHAHRKQVLVTGSFVDGPSLPPKPTAPKPARKASSSRRTRVAS